MLGCVSQLAALPKCQWLAIWNWRPPAAVRVINCAARPDVPAHVFPLVSAFLSSGRIPARFDYMVSVIRYNADYNHEIISGAVICCLARSKLGGDR